MPSFSDELTPQQIRTSPRSSRAVASSTHGGDVAPRAYAYGFVSEALRPSQRSRDPRDLWQEDASAYACRARAGRDVLRRRPSTRACPPSPTWRARARRQRPARSSSTSCSSWSTPALTGSSSAAPHGSSSRSSSRAALGRRRARPSAPRGGRRPLARALGRDARRARRRGARRDLARVAPAASADAFDRRHASLRRRPLRLRRRRARATCAPRGGCLARRRVAPAGGAAERFLAGAGGRRRRSCRRRPDTPRSSAGSRAWVDGGLAHRSRAPWNLGLRLDEDGTGA